MSIISKHNWIVINVCDQFIGKKYLTPKRVFKYDINNFFVEISMCVAQIHLESSLSDWHWNQHTHTSLPSFTPLWTMVCCTRQSFVSRLKKNALLVFSFTAIILGVCIGVGLRQVHMSYDAVSWLSIWGELFMRMLKCLILPLVASCLIVGELLVWVLA